jgi:cytochrome b involved in lipid metabolism
MPKRANIVIATIIILAVAIFLIVQAANKQKTTSQQTGGVQQPSTVTPAPTGTYTMADVSSHGSASSCWTTINGSVYDVTSWINQHPGGAEAILSLCGKDGTAAFTGQHNGDRRPAAELASFKIGTLGR